MRFQDCTLYWIEWLVIKFISTLIWDWVKKLRVNKWRILDEKVESSLMLDSELLSGIPRLCRLRTALDGPCGTSIDYVLTHTEFKGSRKLSSFDSH
jgi:hypothetical protein